MKLNSQFNQKKRSLYKDLVSFKSFLLLFIVALTIYSCKKQFNYGLDNTVSAVQSLYAPQDNFSINLAPATGGPVTFQWSEAKAQDGSLVLYEVAFDTAGGNFSKPIFKLPSDGNGQQNQATLTQSQLNNIAALAHVAPLSSGTFIWTVYSTKGLYEVKAQGSRTITLTRPAGFDNPPGSLYLTGSATEGGTDISKAIQFKQTGTGLFELYTSLTSGGSYQFIDKNSGTPTTYYVSGPNIKQMGSTTYTDTNAVVRFNLDFPNGVATLTRIRGVGFWHGLSDSVVFYLNYAGNSTWNATNQTVPTANKGWGPEPRYKFRFTVNPGGGASDTYEWYGSKNGDNPEPNSSTTPDYWYLFPATNDQWNNSYKFAAVNTTSIINVQLYLQPNAPYTHAVQVIQ